MHGPYSGSIIQNNCQRYITMTSTSTEDRPIRVILQQGALPKYRVPVFRELASRRGINLRLIYAGLPGLNNVEPDGFEGTYIPMWQPRLLGHPIYWHWPQWRYATREHADVMILSWDVHFASLLPALLRARANGVGTILWGHGISKQETRLRGLPRHIVARLADALLFYNDKAAKRYLEMGWDPQRLYVARNALDQDPIQEARRTWLDDPQRLQAFQQEHALAGRPVILFVSRLDGQRRAGLLVHAAARLVKTQPQLKIVFIGQGPDESKLRELARKEGLSEHVHFTGALYDEMKLAPWFLSSTVFCFPTNIGLSLLHAFGYGLPVITSGLLTNHGPEIEALRNEQNGLLYENGSIDSLVAALRRLLEDPALTRRMGQEAHRTATEDYSVHRMVDGMEAAIRYCAALSPATGCASAGHI
jgi:glycosyltransferase involved in cell wall biosynthesis